MTRARLADQCLEQPGVGARLRMPLHADMEVRPGDSIASTTPSELTAATSYVGWLATP